jgi:chromate reductase
VVRLKAAVAAAEALLIVTPEYNYSVPGVLQNAIDWASRPGMNSVLVGKPAGIMGVSTGAIGTARAQQQLKLVLMGTLCLVMPHAGVLVGLAKDKFDGSGTLTHEPTRHFVAAYLKELEAWTRRVAPPSTPGR